MKFQKRIIAICFASIFCACSSDNDTGKEGEASAVEKFTGTQSPGDVWEWTLNNDNKTFTCVWDYGTFENLEDDITISGTYTVLPSGFLNCKITGVSPETQEVPADGTAWFYALHLPDMAMIIKPEGSIKGDLIAAVASGECSDVVGEYNYFLTAFGDVEALNINTEEAFGRATFLESGEGMFDIHGDQYSLDCINDGPCTVNTGIKDSPAATCTQNGSIVISSDEGRIVSKGQFTGAGVMMLDQGKGNGGVFAVSKDNILTIEALEGLEFTGLAYQPTQDEKTVPVYLSFEKQNGFLKGVGKVYEDITSGTLENEGVGFEFDSEDKGLIYGQIAHSDDEKTNFAASVISSDGKKLLVLSSTSSSGKDPFIILAVNK